MTKADYIVSLIKAHYGSEQEKFTTIALQMAAHESRLGHTIVANNIKDIIDKAKDAKHKSKAFAFDLQGLVQESAPPFRLIDMIASDDIKAKVNRIILEFAQRDKLRRYNLENRRKILLSGPPGTGKTLTASIIANQLNLPLYTILMDKMVTKFMGETSAKLRQIFDLIEPEFGRLTVFDPRLPHGVNRVDGVQDPREARLVLHGWFTQPEPIVSKGLLVKSVQSQLADLIRTNALLFEGSENVTGVLSFELKVLPNGRISRVLVLTQNLQSRDGNTDYINSLIAKIAVVLKTWTFSRGAAGRFLIIPLVFE